MEKRIDLQTFEDDVFRTRAKGSISETKGQDFDRDRYELARVGKQQVLKRRFGLVSMTGLSCGLMCTWESLLVIFSIGFTNGGPAGLIYGFIIIWLGNFSVFICIGELASAVPTAGGQYHWVSLLAPRSNKKFFSYVTGWLTVIGWIAALTSVCFFVADLILQLVSLNDFGGGFVREGWHGTLLLWAILLLCVFINVFVSGALPAIEVVVLIVHVLGFFGILVPLVYLTSTHNSAKQIFTTFHNTGNWSTQALAFFVGLQGNALAFVGTDSVVHMSEEVRNASTDVPRSMLFSLVINGSLALGMLFAVLFSAEDIQGLLDEDAPTSPFIRIFRHAVGSEAGATVMVSIIILLEFCSAMGCLAAASRMTWSFARDRGLPFSRALSMIDKRSTIPVVAIIVVTVFSALLALINIGNNAAFNGTISLVLEGFYLSYLLALGLLLWRRLRGDLDNPDSSLTIFNSGHVDEAYDRSLTWGPWRLKGALGVANNVVAICYLLLIIFFSFWPNTVNPDLMHMNWAGVVTGSVALFSVAYYLLFANKSYTGPIVEVDPHVL
ncbi:amino acid transporter [Cucurbitaria berberidis CBS 394.84]|uniref:Amino acid transporter n=1 Tax=Cucurbitaria berberidis CBS 394.84 TaxID=1168544 RepID=A0A9P4L6G4_9PLEO|nr:amino acid transporter [Cucurbitaria berberidis CBS 394.84]KAF1843337.1 amino acid transporter [Cucurbitaria berberidis CBS 394.84]